MGWRPVWPAKPVQAAHLVPPLSASNRLASIFQKGGTVADAGFWSSSINRRIARKFTGYAGVLFEVHASSGRFIGPASEYLREREVLFAPGVGFRVRSVKRRGRVLYVVIDEVEGAK
ncbi:MAG: ADP-ribosyltransferase domain-containing protein [Candidatus Binataceae bacterium]